VHQVLIVGGPNTQATNPRWRTAAILENRSILMKFSIVMHIGSKQGENLKFRVFEIQNSGGRQLKNKKSRHLGNGLTDFRAIWHDDAKSVS